MGIEIRPLPVQEHAQRCCGFGGQPECADPGFVEKVRKDRAEESSLPYICYCMNCREAFIKAGKPSLHILELRYGGIGEHGGTGDAGDAGAPELSPSARRANREALRASFEGRLDRACVGTDITLADDIIQKMDEDKILAEDVYATVNHARRTASCFLQPASGVRSGQLKIGRATYWVDYLESGDTGHTTITAVYSHRLAIELEEVWGGVRRNEAGLKGSGQGSGHEPGQEPGQEPEQEPGQEPLRRPASRHLPPAARERGGPCEDGQSGVIHEACNAQLIEMEAQFSYLGRSFRHKVLRCPACGLVYIPEGLARGRMREVEMALEDK
jgi:hypothetical protein